MTALPHHIAKRALGKLKTAAQQKGSDASFGKAARDVLAAYEAEMAAFRAEVKAQEMARKATISPTLTEPEA